jgi:hypothetical protein
MAQQQVFAPNNAKVEPYPFADEMERALATLLASRPKLYARLGAALDPKGFSVPVAKLALEAIRAIAHDSGRGPDHTVLVIQRLKRWMADGRITQDDINEVVDMFDAAEDSGLPSEEAVISEVAPILQRRAQRDAIESALADYQKRQDPTHAFQLLEKAQRIGEVEETTGVLVGSASFEAMERLKKVDRLPSGILELDDALAGGFLRGTETVYIAGTGGGKSQALIQNATASALRGFFTGYVTLELPEEIILARLKANMTGLFVDDILADPSRAKGALARITSHPGYGGIVVGEFTPKVTTVGDLRDWVESMEQRHGRRMDVLVVDYADRLGVGGSRRKKDRDEENTYASALDVYEELRIWGNDTGRWVFTASQAQRAKDKGKKLGVDDVADSMHKVRVTDYAITLNPRDEGATLLWHIAKNRLGKANANIGPLPVQFECGRIGPITWPEGYEAKPFGQGSMFG